MVTLLNNGMLGLMISVGHRTALFDTMGSMPAADGAADEADRRSI